MQNLRALQHVIVFTHQGKKVKKKTKGNTMLHKYISIFFCLFGLLLHSPCISNGMQNNAYSNQITTSTLQKTTDTPKWRLIYIEGGPYIDFPHIFCATIDAMHTLGLIDHKYPYEVTNENSSREIWNWLSKNAGGDYIEFVNDGFYSSNWDADRRIENKNAILDRIKTKNDIDIILTFGTGAGRDLATNEHHIPTLSMSVTDAVQAGIIKSVQDSGLDHVHGQVEIGRYERQVSIFHDVFNFKKLGVPVPDTDEGKASIAYKDIIKTSEALGFEIVPCEISFLSEGDIAFTGLLQCIETLSKDSDAIYMTTNTGMQWDKMPALLKPIIDAGIPSFSQSGLMETKLGILMSIAQSSFASEGIHGAATIKMLLEGTKPRDIGQVFEGPLGIALNLEMARLIGWNPPFEILVAVDIIYKNIDTIEDDFESAD